jgi:SPP1 gp7 family putative phage head morphogenesis protein
MSANDYLLDAGIKHQIYVQRYAGGQVKDLVKYLDDAQAEILRQLKTVKSLAESRTLNRKLNRIVQLQQEGLTKLSAELTAKTMDFAEYEADFAVRTMNTAAAAAVTLPASEQLRALVTQRPMQLAISGKAGSTVQNLTLDQAARQFAGDKASEIRRVIQTGVVEGSTVQSLTRDIVSVTNRHKRQAETLVRTSVNHISSEARSAVNQANDDILKGEEWVAVLDSRTTIGCATLDGKILGFNEPPFTPRHWGCRSVRVPVLNDEFQEGGLEGTRASIQGPVSAKRTYSGWLKDQSPEFQDQMLGKERGKLFRSGKIKLDQFVDENYNPVSLEQLRVLDAAQ